MTCLGRDQADLTDPGACEAMVAASDADAVINAAAYTAVDKAESDRDTAMIVNAMAPTAMAAAAAARASPSSISPPITSSTARARALGTG